MGLISGGECIDAHGAVFTQLRGKYLRYINLLHFFAKIGHFGQLFIDFLFIRFAATFLFQHALVGVFDGLLQLTVFFRIQAAEILGSLKHHVLQQVSDTGFSGLFQG